MLVAVRARHLLLPLVLLSTVAGCGHTAYSVRAFRTYATDDASLDVTANRIDDIATVVGQLDELLLKTPYSPGAKWVTAMPLTDEKAAQLRERVRGEPPYNSSNSPIPVIKLYRLHLEDVKKMAADENAETKGKYASILDSMGSLSSTNVLKDKILAYQAAIEAKAQADVEYEIAYQAAIARQSKSASYEPEVQAANEKITQAKKALKDAEREVLSALDSALASANGEEAQDIIRDGTAAISVALRVDLESLALLPILVVHAFRKAPSMPKELAKKPTAAVTNVLGDLASLPSNAEKIEDRLERQAVMFEKMALRLAKARGTKLDLLPAMTALKESAVDMLVGVTLESVRVQVRATGEGLFFSQITDKTSESTYTDSNGTEHKTKTDFSARTRRVGYDVQPIWFAGGRADVALDWPYLPNAANLSAGYKTSVSSGGNIDTNGSLAKELGATGVASFVLDLGLGVAGVKASFRTAQFTSGIIQEIDTSGSKELGIRKAPLQITMRNIDIMYDIAFLMPQFAGKYYIEEFSLGYRNFDYQLPRIVYELENTSTNDNDNNFEVRRQSRIQNIRSNYHMGGLNVRFGPGEGPWWAIFGDLGLFFGGGPTEFRLPTVASDRNIGDGKTPTLPLLDDDPKNRLKQTAFNTSNTAFNARVSLGGRIRFFSPGTRFRFYSELLYVAEVVSGSSSTQSAEKDSNTGTQTKRARSISYGGDEVFHGPRFNLLATF